MDKMIKKMLTRHAIRRFQKKQIEEEVLEQILTAGIYAPSGGNNQGIRIVASQNKEVNETLGKQSRYMQFKDRDPAQVVQSISVDQPSIKDDLTLKDGFYHAPTVLTIFASPSGFPYQEAAMAAENMWLAAHFLGVGACYICRTEEVFDTEYGRNLRKEWGIEEDLIAVGNMILGYREGPEPAAKPRKENRIVRV